MKKKKEPNKSNTQTKVLVSEEAIWLLSMTKQPPQIKAEEKCVQKRKYFKKKRGGREKQKIHKFVSL
jgi:hypothetical protein